MLDEIMLLDKKFLNNIKFFIQIPKSHIKIYKKYLDYLDNTRCIFFFKDNLNYKLYDLILSGLVQALFMRFYIIIIMFFLFLI